VEQFYAENNVEEFDLDQGSGCFHCREFLGTLSQLLLLMPHRFDRPTGKETELYEKQRV